MKLQTVPTRFLKITNGVQCNYEETEEFGK